MGRLLTNLTRAPLRALGRRLLAGLTAAMLLTIALGAHSRQATNAAGAQPAAKVCPLDPNVTAPAYPPVPTTGSDTAQTWKYTSGSLAFDGQYLDYTYAPADNPQPGGPPHGVSQPGQIYRVDPSTCARPAPLTLSGAGAGRQIYFLTYDPRLPFDGRVGALLARGGQDLNTHTSTVYEIDPVTGASAAMTTLSCSDPNLITCSAGEYHPSVFAYDYFRDQVWTHFADMRGNPSAGLMKLSSGAVAPSCMEGYPQSAATQREQVATWTVGGDGIAYGQIENDSQVDHISVASCGSIDSFVHGAFQEADAENDQLACDPLTFGNQSDLWIRDQANNQVTAFPIPDGFCPFPDRLALSASATTVQVSTAFQVCAELSKASDPPGTISGAPVQITISGQKLSSITDSGGAGCVTYTAPPSNTTLVASAGFSGSHAFLPAISNALTINVVGQVPPAQPPASQAPPPQQKAPAPLPPPQQPPPAPVQAQAFQAQPVPLPQVAMSSEQQDQLQMTLQGLNGRKSGGFNAARRPDPRPALALQGLALMGFGLTLYITDRALRRRNNIAPAKTR